MILIYQKYLGSVIIIFTLFFVFGIRFSRVPKVFSLRIFGFFLCNYIYKTFGFLFELFFNNVNCVSTSLSNKAVDSADSYHPHFALSYHNHFTSTRFDNTHIFYNFKYTNYNKINKLLFFMTGH